MKHLHLDRGASFQQGFAAIAAIFLVVVLSALGAFMLTFSNTSQLNSAKDVLGSRAYWAARAGLEWGVAGVVTATACPVSPTTLSLESFTVEVVCTPPQAFSEGTATVNVFSLTSKAQSSGTVGSVGYVERSVSGAIER